MTRVARAMGLATKRVMATNGNSMGDGYGEEGCGHLMVATIVMGMGTAQWTWLFVLRLERGE